MPLLKSPMDRRTGAAWLLTTCILAWTDAFGPLCTDMYLPCLPALALDLDISAALAQSSITATFIGMALGQLILGPLSDGLGRRRLLLASCLLFAAASLMCMQARSGPELLALRFLQGFGGAGGAVLTRSICCDLYQGPTLTAYLAMLLAINCAAPILSPVAGGFVGAEWGWPAIFLVLGAAGLVLALAVLLAIPETLPPERRVKGGMAASLTNAARLFRCRGFVLYLGVQGFTHAGFFAYIAASPFILQNIYGISQQSYGLLFGAIAVGLLTSSMLAARLAGRIGNVRMLVAGDSLRAAACLAVLAACVIMPASPVPLLCGVFAMVVLQGLTVTASFALAAASQDVGEGAASGVLGVTGFLAGAISSPIAGLAGAASALPFGLVAAASGLASLACALAGARHTARDGGCGRA